MKSFWVIVVLLCGALLPVQTGLNAKLGKHLSNSVQAAMICFVVGAIITITFLIFNKGSFSISAARSAGALALLGGGSIGVIYITFTMLALPRLGMALTFALTVAGQVLMAALLDHFKILVPHQHTISLLRFIGIALIILGVVIVQKT